MNDLVDRSKTQVNDYVGRGKEYVERGRAQWDEFVNQGRQFVNDQTGPGVVGSGCWTAGIPKQQSRQIRKAFNTTAARGR